MTEITLIPTKIYQVLPLFCHIFTTWLTGSLGNVFWEEMYEELGGKDKKIKVILTIRDGDEIWYNSWLNFFDRNFNRYGIRLGTWMAWFGGFGNEIKEMTRIGKIKSN